MVSEHENLGGGFKHFLIFFFHPYLGKIPNLTNIFRWVETTNQKPSQVKSIKASDHAFAAILDDKTVVAWGTDYRGGDSWQKNGARKKV